MSTNPLILPGCTPTPLASYLKALGILRVLSRQFPEARVKGYWRDNSFVLVGACDAEAIVDFFLRRYEPAPLVAPWNGGSGFHPKDNSKAIDAIASSQLATFATYRDTIAAATRRASLARPFRETGKRDQGKTPPSLPKHVF